MRTLFLILAILNVCLLSCKNHKSEQINFVIKGESSNGEGEEICLHILDQEISKKQNAVIIDGKFEFSGTINKTERAIMFLERDKERGYYYPLYLSSDTIFLSFTIDEKEMEFLNCEINDNGINDASLKHDSIYSSLKPKTPRVNKSNQDSLRLHTFPNLRTKSYDAFRETYRNCKFPILELDHLNLMMEGYGIFNHSYLNNNDRVTFKKLLDNINPVLNQTTSYKKALALLSKINDPDKEHVFKDFSLLTTDNKRIKLSQIVRNNKFTVIDFWISWCGPCRRFNRTEKESYKKLKANGIEIVGVNLDYRPGQWLNSTKEDSIVWVNLFGGDLELIEPEYRVKVFPTKIIFDSNLNFVDFEFEKTHELLKLLETTEN